MRQVPIGPDVGWHDPHRWICQLRLTCADLTRRYGFEFVEDPNLPRNFFALVENEGELLVLEAVPESLPPVTYICVSASGNVRTPRRVLERVLAAFECTVDQIEAVSDDLSEWPWMLTRDDDRGGRELHVYLRDVEETSGIEWLRQRYPERNYRVEPAR